MDSVIFKVLNDETNEFTFLQKNTIEESKRKNKRTLQYVLTYRY